MGVIIIGSIGALWVLSERIYTNHLSRDLEQNRHSTNALRIMETRSQPCCRKLLQEGPWELAHSLWNTLTPTPSPTPKGCWWRTTVTGGLCKYANSRRQPLPCAAAAAAAGTQQLGWAVFREDSFGVITTSSGQQWAQRTQRFMGLCFSLPLLSPGSPEQSREDGQVWWFLSRVRLGTHQPVLSTHYFPLSNSTGGRCAPKVNLLSLLHCRNPAPSPHTLQPTLSGWSLSHPCRASSNATCSGKPSLTRSGENGPHPPEDNPTALW